MLNKPLQKPSIHSGLQEKNLSVHSWEFNCPSQKFGDTANSVTRSGDVVSEELGLCDVMRGRTQSGELSM